MKNIFYLIFIIGSLLYTANSCKVDNFPYPNAKVYGAMRDTIGGASVETDLNTGSQIGAWELGQFAANPVRKNWVIKQNGEYRNDLVYANVYKFEFSSCNFFPYIDTLTVKPGDNLIDFPATPFIRVKNLTIALNTTTNKIEAKFNLEGGRPSVKVGSITLYSWTDMYVGEYVKKTLVDAAGSTQSFGGAGTAIVPATQYTLSINLTTNPAITNVGFGVHRDYYFRVGAKAVQAGVGTIRSNYAPYVVIAL
jgi:hypothetical protein